MLPAFQFLPHPALRVLTKTPLLPSPIPPSLPSSDAIALLSLNPKGKGHYIDGGRGLDRGHDGQPFTPCEHCQQTNHCFDQCW